MVKTQEQAQADLEPYKLKMWNVVQGGLRTYVQEYASVRHYHSLRTQSSIINDLMVTGAKQLFAETPGVRFHQRRNAFLIVLDNGYVIKLKKLNKQLKASNILTMAVMDFVGQGQLLPTQLHLDGVPPPPTNLHLGYQLTGLALADSKIWVTCPDGAWTAAWSWEITDAGSGAVLPFDTNQKQDNQQQAQVRSRRFKKRETAESAESAKSTEQAKSDGSADKR